MRDKSEGGESDPVVDVRRHCKKNSSVLSCIDKRTKSSDRGSEFRIAHSGQNREWPVPLRKPRKSDKRENYVKDIISKWISGCPEGSLMKENNYDLLPRKQSIVGQYTCV